MEEEHRTGLGCLIFFCVVSEIVKCIFVYPKMQHEFKGFYIQGGYPIQFYLLDCQFMVRLFRRYCHYCRVAVFVS